MFDCGVEAKVRFIHSSKCTHAYVDVVEICCYSFFRLCPIYYVCVGHRHLFVGHIRRLVEAEKVLESMVMMEEAGAEEAHA